VVARREGGVPVAYVSWNGATRVARWQPRTGTSTDRLDPREALPRKGFETRVELPTGTTSVAVTALAADGSRLGESAPVSVPA
jgi:hypothetical protein